MKRTMLAAVLLASCAHAAPAGWTKPDAVTGFGGWRAELQRIVNEDEKAPVGHFCVVVKEADPVSPYRIAYVYWQEGQIIQGYGASRYNQMTPDMRSGAGRIDLRNGLVDTRAQIGTSTALETRSHANRIINQCKRYGEAVVLRKEPSRGSN